MSGHLWGGDQPGQNPPRKLTLTEFLLARIAEDEDVARGAGGDVWAVYCPYSGDNTWADPEDIAGHLEGPSHADESSVEDADGETVVYNEGRPTPEQAAHIVRHDPARVLAECEAKRQVLEFHDDQHDDGDPRSWAMPYVGCGTLRALALPYADHPDYRDEWKP